MSKLRTEIDNWIIKHRNQNGTRLWLLYTDTWCNGPSREQLYQIIDKRQDSIPPSFVVISVNKQPDDIECVLTRDMDYPDSYWSTRWGVLNLTASTHAATIWAEQLLRSINSCRSIIYDISLPVKGIPDIVLSYLLL